MDINLPRSLDTKSALDFAYTLGTITPTEAVVFYPTFTWARPFGMLLTMAAIKQMRAKFAHIPFSMNILRIQSRIMLPPAPTNSGSLSLSILPA